MQQGKHTLHALMTRRLASKTAAADKMLLSCLSFSPSLLSLSSSSFSSSLSDFSLSSSLSSMPSAHQTLQLTADSNSNDICGILVPGIRRSRALGRQGWRMQISRARFRAGNGRLALRRLKKFGPRDRLAKVSGSHRSARRQKSPVFRKVRRLPLDPWSWPCAQGGSFPHLKQYGFLHCSRKSGSLARQSHHCNGTNRICSRKSWNSNVKPYRKVKQKVTQTRTRPLRTSA